MLHVLTRRGFYFSENASECFCIRLKLTEFSHSVYKNFPIIFFPHLFMLPGSKMTYKKMLRNLSFCIVISKYWINSFLSTCLYFFLERTDRRPQWSELMSLSVWVENFYISLFTSKKLRCISSDQPVRKRNTYKLTKSLFGDNMA